MRYGKGILARFLGLGKGWRRRDLRKQSRDGRKLLFESLEARQLLTAAPLALAASANPVAVDTSVTFTATAPSTYAGNYVSFAQDSTSLGTAQELKQIPALAMSGSGGMTTSLSLDPGSFPNMTIGAWVDSTGSTDSGQIVSCFDGSGGGFWRGFGLNTDGCWYVQVGDGNWQTGVADPGGWQQVTVVFSSTDIQLYVNGAFAASYGSPGAWGSASTSGTMTIGCDDTTGYPEAVDGYLNEVDVWQTALTTTEVAQLYNNGIGIVSNNVSSYPAAAEMAAGFHLTSSSDGTVPDFTGHTDGGTLFGSAGITNYVGFQATATATDTPSFSTPSTPSDPDSYPQITASYTTSGAAVATAYVDETVLADSTTTLAVASSATQSQPVDLTATVTGDDGVPTGVVAYYAGPDSLYLGSAPLSEYSTDTATATLTTTQIPVTPGTSTGITAIYQGDANFATSQDDSQSVTIIPSATPTLTVSQSTIVTGQPDSLTATVPGSDAGSLQFYDGGSALGSSVSVGAGNPDPTVLQLDAAGGVTTSYSLPSSAYSSTGFTISAWVQVTGSVGGDQMIASFDDHDGGYMPGIGVNGDGDWYVQVGSGGGGIWDTGVRADIGGGWHSVVLVVSTSDVLFYYDGTEYDRGTAGGWYGYGSTNKLTIGYDGYDYGCQAADANISEVDVWDTALDSSYVQDVWNSGSVLTSGYPESPAAGFHLNDGSSDISDFVNGSDEVDAWDSIGWTTAAADSPIAGRTFSYTTQPDDYELTGTGLNNITAKFTDYDNDYAVFTSAAAPVIVLDTTPADGVSSAPPMYGTPSPLTDGSLVQSVAFTTGSLNYVSDSLGNATVSVDAALGTTEDPLNDHSLTTIGVTVELNGDSDWKNTVYYSVPSGFDDTDAATDYRFTVPIDPETPLDTGTYSYSMTFTAYSSGDTSGTAITTINVAGTTGTTSAATGYVNVLNRNSSQFGQGWNLDGLDALYLSTSGGPTGVTYVRSDGTMGFFSYSESAYSAPAGPFAFLKLTTFTSGEDEYYALQDPSTGTMEIFSSTGQLQDVYDHDGNETVFAPFTTDYGGFTITDPAGRVTAFHKDAGGQIATIVDFAGRTTTLGYGTSGTYPQLITVTLPDPNNDYISGETRPVFNFGYDSTTGLMTSYEDADGNTTTFAYRSDDTLQTVTAPDSTTVTYQSALYPHLPLGEGEGEGSLGQVIDGYALGGSSNPAALILSCTAVGVQTDESGNPTVETVDAFGDPTSVENALGNTTVYDRNDNGQVTEMIQPSVTSGDSTLNPTTYYSYDATTGMLTGQTNPDGELLAWVYAPVTLTIDGQSVTYNVLTQSGGGLGAVPDGTTPPVDQIESFTWTTTGDTYVYSADSSTDGSAVYVSSSDTNDFYGVVSGDTVTWTYNDGTVDTDSSDNAPVTCSYISCPPRIVKYGYNDNADLTSVTDWPSDIATTYTYETLTLNGHSVAGILDTVTDPNENVTTYSYYTSGNDAGLVEDVEEPNSGTTYLSSDPRYVAATYVYYGYNSADDLTSMSNPVPADTTLSSANTTYYEYDGLDRQVNETDPENAQDQSPQSKMSYDAMGNVIQESDLQAIVDSGTQHIWETTTYSYNSLEELTEVSAPGPNNSSTAAVTTYTYTPTGQVYQVTDADSGTTTYSYDAIGEQTSVSLPDPATGKPGGPTTTYTFDALGRVLTETAPPPAPDDGGGETTYNYTFGTTSDPGVTLVTTPPDPSSGEPDDSDETTQVYDPYGDLVSETTPSPAGGDNTTAYEYDALGRPMQQSVNGTTYLGPVYDADGNVTSNTDLQNGAETDYTYNAQNELVQTTGSYPDPQDAISGGTPTESSGWSFSETETVYVPPPPPAPLPPSPPGTGYMATIRPPTFESVTSTYSGSDSSGNTATWSFSNLVPGQQYAIQATWDADPTHGTTDASLSYQNDSGSSVSLADLNEQQSPSADYVSFSTVGETTTVTDWQNLVVFTAAGTTATLELVTGSGSHLTLPPQVQIQEARPVTTYTYNAVGEMTGESDPLGNVSAYSYDADGSETSMSLPDPANGGQDDGSPTTSYTYDLLGNLLTTTAPSPTGVGNVTTVNTYDQQNNLVSSEDADGNVTAYTYDPLANMLSLTDTDGNSTLWSYDHLGEETSQSSAVALGYFPDGTANTLTATSYAFYDANGNLTTSIDADGRSIGYTNDYLNRETGETWNDAAGDETGTVAYGYNSAGEMSSASNAAADTEVASYGIDYDIVGNVSDVAATLPGADGTTVQLASAYDYNGERTELAMNIGTATPNWVTTNDDGGTQGDFASFTSGTDDFVNTYSYDWQGDMTSVVQTANQSSDELSHTDVAAKTVTFGYDADQRVTSQNFYNADGTTDPTGLNSSTLVAGAAYSYDHDSNLTDLTYKDGANTLVAGYHYDYNIAGLVTDEYSFADSSAGTPNTSYVSGSSNWGETAYSYDPDAQLTAATYTNFAGAPSNFSESHDPNGNLATNPSTSNAQASSTDRVLFDGQYYYNYDAEGNRTARYMNSTDSGLDCHATDITIYTYNNDNEMTAEYHFGTYSAYHLAVEANDLDNGTSLVATMENDAFGRMVQETTYTVDGDSETGSTENYVFDGENLVLVLNSSGLVTERELTGPAVDQVFATEYPTASGGEGGAQGAGTANYWYLTDAQGSVRDVVNGVLSGSTMTAAVVDHVIYTAFGAPTVEEGAMPRFGFDGMRYDAATGFDLTATRPYDPDTGTWIQSDPIGFLGGQDNLSEFVGNNPTNFVDPLGLLDWDFGPGGWLGDALVGQFVRGLDAKGQPLRTGDYNNQVREAQLLAAQRKGDYELSQVLRRSQLVGAEGDMQNIRLLAKTAIIFEASAPGLAQPGAVGYTFRPPPSGGAGAPIRINASDLKLSGTVQKQLSDVITKGPFKGELANPYTNSRLLMQQIMRAKPPIPDPGGIPGGLRWDVSGSFRGGNGTWELVVDPNTNTVVHFKFTTP